MTRFASLSILLFGFAACAAQSDEPMCGNDVCEVGETHASCPEDCPAPPGDAGSANHCGDGVCNDGETTATCPVDCPMQNVCGDSVCESTETTASCPQDCDANQTIVNDSSYVIEAVYIWPCNTTVIGNNQLAAQINVGGSATVERIPPGCYDLGAANSGATELWESDNNQLTAGGWTWTLTNATAIAN